MTTPEQPPTTSSSRGPLYDLALKAMLLRAPNQVLALFTSGLTWQGELSPELPATARAADVVWKVADEQGQHGLIHIELQTSIAPNIGERIAEYGLRLWLREHLPVRSAVIFLRPGRLIPSSPFVVEWIDGQRRLQYEYDVIRLWELPPALVLDSPNYALWPLASLMAGATAESTVAVAERLATLDVPRGERSDLLAVLLTLAGLRPTHREVLRLLRSTTMLDDLIKESGTLQMLFAEERAEARDEGRTEGLREAIRAVLQARFGALDADLLDALDAATPPALQRLLEQVTTISLPQAREQLGTL